MTMTAPAAIAAAGLTTTARPPTSPQRITKPWGWEEIWATTPHYCGKKLFVATGKRLSLQYHDLKVETQYLIAGEAALLLEDDEGELQLIVMEPGVGYTILAHRRHRLIGLNDAIVIEVSTPEIGTTYRLQDDYGRPDETEAVRARPNRV